MFLAHRPIRIPAGHEVLEALEAGDAAAHSFGSCDCILLAQFSLARAAAAVAAATGKPVVTTPDAAVRALRAAVSSHGQRSD